MSITPLPTPPSRADSVNFAQRADAFMAALPTYVDEFNALQVDVTTKQGTASAAATTATEQAVIATTKAGQAANSEEAAFGSATAAGAFEAAALAHKNAAGVSAGNAAGSEAAAAASAASVDASILRWMAQPIGVPIPFRDDIAGVEVPPTDNPNFRYIKLTAGDVYNTGVLTNEVVSGSAPLVLATAVVALAGSPINGTTLNLWNTERRSPRGGSSGALENDAFQDHIHNLGLNAGGAGAQAYAAAAASLGASTTTSTSTAVGVGPRFSTETRIKSQGVTYYMRAK